jgi:VCBS repeat-containing protein
VPAPGVLGNDTDPDGDSLDAVLDTGPSDGSLTLNSNGSFTYTPDANFNGSDSFTYRANDGSANSNTATVTITVGAVNDPPTANNNSYSTNEDTTLNVSAPGVLGNDTDPEGQPLTAVLQNGPSDGSLTLNSNGSFTYTPDTNFNGSDSFTYRANDGSANSNVATVTITVNPINDPPTANNNSYSTNEDTTLTIAAPGVLGNDTDPDGDSLTAVLQNGPSDGSLTLNSNGSFSYAPVAGFNGTDSFTYRASDGSANSNVATVTITVNPVNDPPTANNNSYSTNEDTTLNVSAPGVLGNDTDPDGDSLSSVLQSGPTDGSLTLNSNGSFSYTPNADFSGTDSFTYFANDGTANSNLAAMVTITVNPVNDPPTATDDAYTIDEDTTLDVAAPGVLGNDTDPEGDSLTAILQNGPSDGSLTLNSNGSFSYAPNPDFNGIDSFTYKANDGASDSDVATVTITVNTVADPPTANNNSYVTNEDTTLNVSAPGVLGNDTDPEGDSLTAILQNGPSDGSLNLNSNGSFSYTPDANFNGSDSFTYRANDGVSDSNVATVTITVNPVPDPPIADAGPDQTVDENTTATLGGSNSFDTEGESITYQWDQIAGPPVTLSDPQTANPTFTAPTVGGPGGESLVFRLTVTDEEAAQAIDTAIVNVTLPLANRPPEADAGTDQNVEEGETVTLNGSNSFDPDGDNLSYQWDQIAGPPVTLLPDPTAEKPTFTAPFVESAGLSSTFELTVTDTNGLQATDTSIVNVTSIFPSANQPPEAVVGDNQTVEEDTTVTLNGSNSSDPEGNLFYRWRQVAGRPLTLSDPSAEQPTFIAPNVGLIGVTLVLELTVTDVGGLQAVVDMLINVAGDDDFPIADAGDDQTVDENTTITLDGFGSFDPEGQNLSYSWRQVVGPSVTLSDPAAERPTFTTPNVTPNGVMLDFELNVTDVVGQQQRDNVEITVFGINELPTADAGDDQTVLEKTTIMLDASNSSDPDVDDIMTYQWNQTGGTAVTLSDPTSKLPAFKTPSFEDAGDQPLIFELIVTDGQGAQSQEDSTTVTVSNFEKKNPGTSGGGCFIATAVYGSSMDSQVTLLSELRDRFLKIKSLGEGFLKLNPNVAYICRGKTR